MSAWWWLRPGINPTPAMRPRRPRWAVQLAEAVAEIRAMDRERGR